LGVPSGSAGGPGALQSGDLAPGTPSSTVTAAVQSPSATSPRPSWLSPRAISPSPPLGSSSLSPLAGSPATTAATLLARLSERMRGLNEIQASLAASSARLDAATEGLGSSSLSQSAARLPFSPRTASILKADISDYFERAAEQQQLHRQQQQSPPMTPPPLQPSMGGRGASHSPTSRPAAAAAAAATANAFSAAAEALDRSIADSIDAANTDRSVETITPIPQRHRNRLGGGGAASAASSASNSARRRNLVPSMGPFQALARASPHISPATSPQRRPLAQPTIRFSTEDTWFFIRDPVNDYLRPNFEPRSGVPLPQLVRA
jgi:hypothetical protein